MFFSAVKLGILTWGVYGIDSLLQPASSGQSMNCSFSHLRVGFTSESGRLPLGKNMGRSKHKIGFLEIKMNSLTRGGALRSAEIKRFPR